MKISEKYLDIAKKWRIRITLDDGSSMFLKFQTEPSEKEVFAEVNKYLANIEAEKSRQVIEANQKVIEEEKASLVKNVSVSTLKTKLGVISGITK